LVRENTGRRNSWLTRATITRVVVSVLLIAAVAVGGYIVTMKVADYQRDQYFEVRKFQAAAAAAAIDEEDVAALTGTPSDAGKATFKKLRSQLMRIKSSDTRMRFVYLMRPQNGKMVFLVDAEKTNSKDYSPPGQVYFEAKPVEFEPFKGNTPPDPWILGPITDRWGTWISANAYIVGADGLPVALLGTDVSVSKALASFNQIRNIGILYDVLACILLALVLLQWIAWRAGEDRREALHRQMDDSMVRLNQELVEADRMKSEFIESASHDLRGPVTAVNTAVQVIGLHMPEDSSRQMRDLVGIAKTGSTRLVELVDDLLDLTRIEAGGLVIQPEDIDAARAVNDTVEMFRAMADGKGLSLEVVLAGEDPQARVDPQAFRRILENLVSNAIKYTDEGKVTVTLDTTGEALELAVSDTGRGIPERFREDAFNKFSRLHLSTDTRERGAGLGLAITRGLVEAHGGRIWIEGEEGKGSTFRVEVPGAKIVS
jgi:signal transduction histidine kinase